MAVTDPQIAPDEELPALYADQTEAVVLARWVDWANEGLDPVTDADQWTDTREGGHWRTVNIGAIREFARVYDLIGTEVPASGFVLWAWEVYLDDLGAQWDTKRLAASIATGQETFTGPEGSEITAGTTLSVVPSTPDDPAPEFEVVTGGTIGGSGELTLAIRAKGPGAAGNVAAGAITAPSTPLPPGVLASNADPTVGGRDVEGDDSLRRRILEAIAGKGPGTQRDYVRWAEAWPDVGRVTCVPVWNGAGTVLVMIGDVDGRPLPDAVVAALQADLDPVPGKGAGTAPVGAIVTARTSTLLHLAAAATVTFETGYSWDGAAGTTAVGPPIMSQIGRYLLSVKPGEAIITSHARGIVAVYPGVHEVTAFTFDAGSGPTTANIALGLETPQVAVLDAFTVS